jgi:hypothetical protein
VRSPTPENKKGTMMCNSGLDLKDVIGRLRPPVEKSAETSREVAAAF